MAKAKLTISVKRRLANGDEVFIAPGIEMDCLPDELNATQEEVQTRINAWMTDLLEAYPDADLDDDEEEDEDEVEEDEEEADEDEDEDEDEIEVSEEEVAKMKLADLKALIKETGIDVDPAGMKVADLREAVIAELFGEEEEGDEEEDEDEDEAEADEDEEEDEDELSEDDLKAMKLQQLQDLCEEWGIGEPKLPKGAKLSQKKDLYIKHIMENAEE